MAYQKLQTSRAAAVVPSDTVNIPNVGGGVNYGCTLYVGTGGNIRVLTAGLDDVTFANFTGGFLPVQVVKVFSTGTAAADILALW